MKSEFKNSGSMYQRSINRQIRLCAENNTPITRMDLDLIKIIHRDHGGRAEIVKGTNSKFDVAFPITQVRYELGHVYHFGGKQVDVEPFIIGSAMTNFVYHEKEIVTNPENFVNRVHNQAAQRLTFLNLKGLELTINVPELGLINEPVNELIISKLKDSEFTQELLGLSYLKSL